MLTHNIAASRAQREIKYPLHVVVRADGMFPYRPDIVSGSYYRLSSHDRASAHVLACRRQVCPRPERKYEAQIGLREMEEQATRTAPVQHKTGLGRASVKSGGPFWTFAKPGRRHELHPLQNEYGRDGSYGLGTGHNIDTPRGPVPDRLTDVKPSANFPSVRLSG